jgi:predicted RNA-binding Zn-ribbon protein involved in translation (DUF1610 family)
LSRGFEDFWKGVRNASKKKRVMSSLEVRMNVRIDGMRIEIFRCGSCDSTWFPRERETYDQAKEYRCVICGQKSVYVRVTGGL